MFEYVKKIADQLTEFFKALSPTKKLATFLTFFAVFSGVGVLFYWAGQTSYRPLMTNLNPEDSASIIRILREKKIPFKVDPTGKNVEVPIENMNDLRLELATMGLPQSGSVGYEIFDKQSLGTTSFVHKINHKRALEGELMRTINSMRGVKRSRIHLVIPEKSAFVEDQRKPSASVVLDIEPGTQLNEKQVFGIGTLVARAVEGMDIADVAIVDSNGKTLSKAFRDSMANLTANQMELQKKFETEIEQKIELMLSRVVGEGKVVARVSADLDFSRVDETQTLYDAEGSAIRSTQKNTETAEGSRPGPVGAPGAASNQPPTAPGAANSNERPGIKSATNRNGETINYDIPQTIRKTVRAPGAVTKMSVAVLVDTKQVKTTAADGKTSTKAEAWAPERIKEIEDLVSSAVGVNLKRGDKIEVKSMEFTREDFEEAQKTLEAAERRSYIQNLSIYAMIAILTVLFFLFLVRPFMKWMTENTIDSVDTFLPKTIEELERMQKGASLPGLEDAMPQISERITPEKVEGEMIKEKVLGLVDTNPQKAAMVMRDWIKGEFKSNKPAAEAPADAEKTA